MSRRTAAGTQQGLRVVRGGSWNFSPKELRAANRNGGGTGTRGSFAGFRVARTL